MLLDEKPIDSLDMSDMEKLISEDICESHRLEYKRDWWGGNDEARREMLRDISSFANASGGHIVVGIETARGTGAGDLECPTKLVGVSVNNYSEMILRSCRDNFDPLCAGIESSQIDLGDGNVVVVIRIPQSLTAPHMVTFKRLNQFWQRHGTDKQPMSTSEVRDLMLSRISLEERLSSLVERQQTEVLNRSSNQPVLLIWAAPITPLLSEIDVKDQYLRDTLGVKTREDPYSHNCSLNSGRAYPTLKGIESQDLTSRHNQHIELHRGGYLQFTTTRFADPYNGSASVVSVRIAIFMENFATLSSNIYSYLQMQGPIAFGCKLLQVQDHRLFIGRDYLDSLSDSVWSVEILDLGYIVSYDFESEKSSILRSINDRLWNAFHFDECPFYSTGQLVIPSR